MDIYIKGVPFTQTITLTSGVVISDTSDFSSITVKIRRLGDTTLLKSLSLASGLTQVSPTSSGKISFTLTGADTVSAKAGAYECEVVTTISGQTPERAILYTFILEEAYS